MKPQDRTLYLSLPLIMLFAYTASSKVQAPDAFYKALLNQPLPPALSSQLVWALPLLELGAAGLLLYPPFRRWGFALSSLLLLGFTGYILLILLNAFGYVPCACGGILEQLSWEQHLLVNLFFWALSLIGLFLMPRPASSPAKKA